MNEILSADAVIIDVGANVGLITCALGRGYRHRKIFAIEASEINFAYLKKNVEKFEMSNVHCINSLLGHRSRKAKVSFWESHNNIKREQTTQITTLDELKQEMKIVKVNLVKIDTDGHEWRILLGSHQLLRENETMWLIERSSSSNRCSSLFVEITMHLYGFRRTAKLDEENILWVKKATSEHVAKSIQSIMKKELNVVFKNSEYNLQTVQFKETVFDLDINAPKNLKQVTSTFEYKSKKPHSNLFSFKQVIERDNSLLDFPLEVTEGSLNIVVFNKNTRGFYVREIFAGEHPLHLPLMGCAGDEVVVTVRSGIKKYATCIWKIEQE